MGDPRRPGPGRIAVAGGGGVAVRAKRRLPVARRRLRGCWPIMGLLLCAATLAGAEPAPDGQPDTNAQLQDLFSSTNKVSSSLPAYLRMRQLPATQFGNQLTATLAAELGLYDQAVALFPFGSAGPSSPAAALPDQSAVAVDAAEAIARLSRGRRIVIVNEAHHLAQTRALFLDLLPRLRQQGFDHYCAEALYDDEIGQRGYPLRSSGIYTREPVFGEVLRTAAKLGYSLCGYDADDAKTQQARETGQAENLARLLREHPDARLIVHAGYGHARKDRTVADAVPMAAELRRLTGLDPLTVDQTTLHADAPRSREHPAYRPLLAKLAGATRASILLDAAGKPWSLQPTAYDVSVVLPDPAPARGRAGWLWSLPGRLAVTGFVADCDGHYPCAIEARHADESPEAVSADIVVRERADANVPAFALAAGQYRLRRVGPDGTVLGDAALQVAPMPPAADKP
ncbi:MAG: hypothetical protein QM601_09545 [Pseudoxanthomonas sp.]